MSSSPRISVVVATRDRPVLLRRALASVALQHYPNVEVCIANDGGDVIEPIVRSCGVDARLIELPTSVGVPAARNAALAMATGEFVAYLDDDDVFLPRHLDHSYRELTSTGADACVSPVWCRHTGGLTLDFRYPHDPEFLLVTNAHPPIAILHRLGAERVLFDEELTVMEDWDLQQRLRYHDGMRFVTKPSVSAIYDRTAAPASSMERRPAVTFLADYRRITTKWLPWVGSERVLDFQRQVVGWYQRQISDNSRLDYEEFLAELWCSFHGES
ncbi:MAG TPA: glycosyltransferase family A protein [Pseudonocardiaceae bacterium]|nr:glycosyltransferase family A protein [Pseudonocardiaceae bacterium]